MQNFICEMLVLEMRFPYEMEDEHLKINVTCEIIVLHMELEHFHT